MEVYSWENDLYIEIVLENQAWIGASNIYISKKNYIYKYRLIWGIYCKHIGNIMEYNRGCSDIDDSSSKPPLILGCSIAMFGYQRVAGMLRILVAYWGYGGIFCEINRALMGLNHQSWFYYGKMGFEPTKRASNVSMGRDWYGGTWGL